MNANLVSVICVICSVRSLQDARCLYCTEISSLCMLYIRSATRSSAPWHARRDTYTQCLFCSVRTGCHGRVLHFSFKVCYINYQAMLQGDFGDFARCKVLSFQRFWLWALTVKQVSMRRVVCCLFVGELRGMPRLKRWATRECVTFIAVLLQ